MLNIGQAQLSEERLSEVAGVSEEDAKRAFELASAKLPMGTTFIKRGTHA